MFASPLYRELRKANVLEAAAAERNEVIDVENGRPRKFLASQVPHEFSVEVCAERKLERGASSECRENALIKRILHVVDWVHSKLAYEACGDAWAAGERLRQHWLDRLHRQRLVE